MLGATEDRSSLSKKGVPALRSSERSEERRRDDHLSRPTIAYWLKRLTHPVRDLFSLSPGRSLPLSQCHHWDAWALTPRFHPYPTCARRYTFCCTCPALYHYGTGRLALPTTFLLVFGLSSLNHSLRSGIRAEALLHYYGVSRVPEQSEWFTAIISVNLSLFIYTIF